MQKFFKLLRLYWIAIISKIKTRRQKKRCLEISPGADALIFIIEQDIFNHIQQAKLLLISCHNPPANLSTQVTTLKAYAERCRQLYAESPPPAFLRINQLQQRLSRLIEDLEHQIQQKTTP